MIVGKNSKPNTALADKFIGKYEASSLDPALEKLKNALLQKDGINAELISHTIKGSSSYATLIKTAGGRTTVQRLPHHE